MTTLIILNVVIVSSVIIAVLVLYAIGKIRSIEEVTQRLVSEGKIVGEKNADASGPFAGLEGKPLWDVLTEKTIPDNINASDIEGFRERYAPVLSKTIKSIFVDGNSDGKFGATRSVPKNERLIKTLRITISSWLPSHELSSLYNSAYDSARAEGEELKRVRMALDDIVGSLYSKVKLPAPVGVSESLLGEMSPDLLEESVLGDDAEQKVLLKELDAED